MKKYLLIAGTGAIGSFLVQKLSKNPNNIIFITTRKDRKSVSNVTFIVGNPHKEFFFDEIFESLGVFDVIVDFMVWTTKEFSAVYEKFLKNCNYYVYMSSSRIYTNTDRKIDEFTNRLYDVSNDRVFLRRDSYAVPKAEQEDILIKSSYNNYVLIRPYITYSPNRLPLCAMEKEIWLYRVIKGRKLVMPRDIGDKMTSLTFGGDCAEAIYKIIEGGYFKGSAINITTDESLKWKEILEIYISVLKHKGYRSEVVYVNRSLKVKNGDYQAIYDRSYDRVFNTQKLKECVKTDDFTSVSEGLADALERFLDDPQFNSEQQDWRYQAQLDKISGECASREEFISMNEYVKYLAYRYLPLNNIRRIVKKCIQF